MSTAQGYGGPLVARLADMPKQVVTVDADSTELLARYAAVREEFKVPQAFPAEVLAEVERVIADPVERVERDETAIPFLTIDPPGSLDLDQALHIDRDGPNYRVRYAIACLTSFIAPGGAIDTEARERGQTIYCPDERVPLHPQELSEGAASLLPDEVRPAYVWDMAVDSTGEGTSVSVYRAMVRSADRFDYEQVQQAIDDGSADERLALLKEVGLLRIAREAERGGANLPMPEQVVDHLEDGSYAVRFRPPLPAEDWNAQISLMTGMAAAELMLGAKVGILRTMPPAEQRLVERFRRMAKALGVPWSGKQNYGEFLRSLDREDPRHLALIYEATSLFRGAGYTPFDGEVPEQAGHAAVASTYAHVTAPLRRLVDRFGLAICAAISAGEEVPAWARDALPSLPDIMKRSDQLANAVNRACVDATEAAVLTSRVGDEFDAVVVDRSDKGATIQVLDPAVVAKADGPGEPGDEIRARLTEADVATSTVRFTFG
jgi:exoribonuclease R